MRKLERLFYSGLILSFAYIWGVIMWVDGDNPNALAILFTPPMVLMTLIVLAMINLGYYDD